MNRSSAGKSARESNADFNAAELRRRLAAHNTVQKLRSRRPSEKDDARKIAESRLNGEDISEEDGTTLSRQQDDLISLDSDSDNRPNIAKPATLRSSDVSIPKTKRRTSRALEEALASMAQAHQKELGGKSRRQSMQPRARNPDAHLNADGPSMQIILENVGVHTGSSDLRESSRTERRSPQPNIRAASPKRTKGYQPQSAAANFAKTSTAGDAARVKTLNRLSLLNPKEEQYRRELESCTVDSGSKKTPAQLASIEKVTTGVESSSRQQQISQGEADLIQRLEKRVAKKEAADNPDKIRLLCGEAYRTGARHDWAEFDSSSKESESRLRNKLAKINFLGRKSKEQKDHLPAEPRGFRIPRSSRAAKKASMIRV